MSIKEDLKDKQIQIYNNGPWNKDECLKYLIFLDQNKVVMASKQKKKKHRVFDQMSDFVQSRSSLQCRSHHQKAIEKFKEIRQIILYQKQQLGGINYKDMFRELRGKAKVKENYEIQKKNQEVQDRNLSSDEMKNENQSTLPMNSPQILPNLYNFIPTQFFPIISISPTQFMNNYFFYTPLPTI